MPALTLNRMFGTASDFILLGVKCMFALALSQTFGTASV